LNIAVFDSNVQVSSNKSSPFIKEKKKSNLKDANTKRQHTFTNSKKKWL